MSSLGIATIAIVIGIIMLLTNVEERAGWLLWVTGIIVAAVVLVHDALRGRKSRGL